MMLGALFLPTQLTASDASALRGVRQLPVVMAISETLESRGLGEDQIRVDTELRLRKAGIQVVPIASQAFPYLTVQVEVSCFKQPSFERCSHAIQLSVTEPVTLVRDRSRVVFAKTWESRGMLGTFGIEGGDSSLSTDNQRAIRDWVGDQVDEFVNAYLEANPIPRRPQ
jgi:hypothetical protein